MRRTYQAFNLFATGIVAPRVALFRKPNPTCTATDKMDELQVGLVITLTLTLTLTLTRWAW